MNGFVGKLVREPLLHFLVLGAALFAVWLWRKDAAGGDSGRIVVTQARIRQLATGFQRMRQRPPTGLELAGLIQDFVREEVCVREATAMGLDRDDTIIRGRLRQKFEFMTEDSLEPSAATDAQRKERTESLFRKLLERYTVVVEPPGTPAPVTSTSQEKKTS